MIYRLFWFATIAALAVVTVFAQLDRKARFAPALAPIVPAAFSGFAAEQRTRIALVVQDGATAEAEARALVEKRPIAAEHLAKLSLAAAMNDHGDTSVAALEAASVRGWREPIAQYASARAALEEGAHDIAAQRVSALLATGKMNEPALDVAARLITTPEGQEAFARRLAAFGRWQANALSPLSQKADPADLAATLALALDQGANLDCLHLRRVTETIEKSESEEVATALREQCDAR